VRWQVRGVTEWLLYLAKRQLGSNNSRLLMCRGVGTTHGSHCSRGLKGPAAMRRGGASSSQLPAFACFRPSCATCKLPMAPPHPPKLPSRTRAPLTHRACSRQELHAVLPRQPCRAHEAQGHLAGDGGHGCLWGCGCVRVCVSAGECVRVHESICVCACACVRACVHFSVLPQ